MPALVSRDRSRSGELMGSALVWRGGASFRGLRRARRGLLLSSLRSRVSNRAGADLARGPHRNATGILHAVRPGYERTDVAAYSGVGQGLLNMLLVVPVLFAGGRLRAVLIAQLIAAVLVMLYVWRALRSIGSTPISFRRETMRTLLIQGSAFLMFDVVQTLQPSIDAGFLGKLAPPEAVGWYAVSRKLVGVLLVPAGALTAALYPPCVGFLPRTYLPSTAW